ncbi:MAG: penicillin-binding protein 2 [Patescibacteria group bacterium]|nr:penicillin-binding protein 2 [Patescibacteria group bacterium]
MGNDPFSVFGDSNDIKNRAIKDYSFNRTEGDIYRPEDAGSESLRLHISPSRLNFLVVLMALGLGTLLFRTGYLQIAQGSVYRQMAEENRIRIQWVKPPRGLIFDRNEYSLVENIPNFIIQAVPADLPKDETERQNIIFELSQTLNTDPVNINNALSKESSESYEPITLFEHIDIEKAIQLKIKSSHLPGISVIAESNRKYTAGPPFSNIIGYIGKITSAELATFEEDEYLRNDYTGKVGLEKSYEKTLRGVYGRNHIEVDSLGKVKKIVASEKAEPGQNLILSIDHTYQEKLQELLDAQVERLNSNGGSAIALDPRNGEVLALVSSPAYDNNLFIGELTNEEYQELINDPKQPLFNRPISGEYPSGSTIKPLIAGAALTEGLITPNTQVLSTGGIKIDKWFFPDWKSGGHGLTNVTKALAESVNTFFYAIGGGYENITGLGVDKINDYATKFGFGKPLNIDLPGEASGFLPTKEWKERVKGEPWYIGDTYHLAIGQGDLLVTPLQITNLIATFANGGTVYQPHLVRAVSDATTGEQIYTEPTVVNQQVIPKNAVNAVRQGLREAVLSGSARSLADLSVSSAGKTGSAQFADNKTHAWFTGFAPYDNPEIVITVMIEGGGEGNATALPVAKDFLTWYYGNR